MRIFLRRVVLFTLPMLFIGYAADAVFTNSLRKSRNYQFAVWNDIFNGAVNAELVVYGSSRAWVHFDPKIIKDSLGMNAYNMGIDGHNFWLQYLRHSLLMEHNPAPKIIIHSIDYSTLQKNRDLYKLEQFLPYMMNNQKIIEATQSYNGFSYYDYRIPFIRYIGKNETIDNAFKVLFRPSRNTEELERGYLPQDQTWNDDLMKAQRKLKQYEIKIDTPSVHLFDEYLRECRDKDITVIFVYTPEYIDGQKFIKNREVVFTLFRMFSQKYDVPFLDYSDDSISFHKKYFFNSTHMNRNGTELFTKRLMHDLKEKGLVKNSAKIREVAYHGSGSSKPD